MASRHAEPAAPPCHAVPTRWRRASSVPTAPVRLLDVGEREERGKKEKEGRKEQGKKEERGVSGIDHKFWNLRSTANLALALFSKIV